MSGDILVELPRGAGGAIQGRWVRRESPIGTLISGGTQGVRIEEELVVDDLLGDLD